MFEKIGSKFKGGFVGVWVSIFAAAAAVLAARLLFFSANSPTLKEVLAGDNLGLSKSGNDISLAVAAVLAFSLAALSIAKGVEVFRRGRPVVNTVLPEMDEELPRGVTDKSLETLKQANDGLLQGNLELKSRLRRLEVDLKELEQVEKMLRRSNITLSKECEKLRSDKEKDLLKTNAIKIRPSRKRTRPKRSAGKIKGKKRKTKK